MRKYISLLGFVLFIVASIVLIGNGGGCGPAKELPDEVLVHKDAIVVPPDPLGKFPVSSDPLAKDVYHRVVNAITEGKMESQARARNCRVTAHGKFRSPNVNQMVETTREVTTVWPDRARTIYEFKEGFLGKRTVGIRGTFGWMHPELPIYYPPSEIAKVIAIDVTAQQWIPVSLDLTEHSAILFDVQHKKTGNESATTFKFGWPNRTDWPIYLVTCDDKTNLPVKIEYWPLSIDRQDRRKYELTLADHKSFLGLMLPTTMSLKANDTLVESWTIDNWEFPEKFEDTLFEKPKDIPIEKPKDTPTKK
jgi:hypothetical protein